MAILALVFLFSASAGKPFPRAVLPDLALQEKKPDAGPPLQVYLNSSYVSGFTAPRSRVTIFLKNSANEVIAESTITADANGLFYVDFRDADRKPVPIAPGNIIETLTESGERSTMTVVELTVGVNVETDLIQGKAPPSSGIVVMVIEASSLFASGKEPKGILEITSDSQGSYSANLCGKVDIKRGDLVSIRHTNSDGNRTVLDFIVPRLEVSLNGYEVTGYGKVNVPAKLTLRNSSGDIKTVATVTPAISWFPGYFTLGLTDQDSRQRVYIRPGDVLEMAQEDGETFGLAVVELGARVNLAADTIQVKGPPNSILNVGLASNNFDIRTDADGNYLASLGGKLGTRGEGSIYLAYSYPDGNQLRLSTGFPSLRLDLSSGYIYGNSAANSTVIANLRSGDNSLKSTASTGTGSQGFFSANFRDPSNKAVPVTPGDIVEVVPETGGGLRLIAEEITARVDVINDAIQGKGPPNSKLQVIVEGQVVIVFTDAQGQYQADFKGRTNITGGNLVRVNYFYPDGNMVYIMFRVSSLNVRLYTNYLDGYAAPGGTFNLTLKDGTNAVKATVNVTSNPDGYFSTSVNDAAKKPVAILPGYIIELSTASGEKTSLTIAGLTIQVDTAAAVITGKGPPDSSLVVWKPGQSVTARTDRQGNYAASFRDKGGIGPQSQIEVRYITPEGNQITLPYALTQLSARLNTNSVSGNSMGNTPLNLILKDASQAIASTTTVVPHSDGRFSANFKDKNNYPVLILPGHTIDAEPLWGERLKFPIIGLTAQVDIASDIVQGKGPAGGKLKVQIQQYALNANADSGGNYTASFKGAFDIKRRHRVEVSYADPNGNQTILSFIVPSLQTRIDSNLVSGYATENTPVKLTLKDPSHTLIATATVSANSQGYFAHQFKGQAGNLLPLVAGHVIELEPEFGVGTSMTIEDLTAEADVANDIIEGKGPANSTLLVTAAGQPTTVMTDARGGFRADLSAKLDIKYGDLIGVYYDNPEMNQVYLNFRIPSLRIRMNTGLISGYTTENTRIQVTLKNSAQSVVGATAVTATNSGYYEAYLKDEDGNPAVIQPGFVVEVMSHLGHRFIQTVEELSATVNMQAGTVTGKGPPNSPLEVRLDRPGLGRQEYTLVATTGPGGDYEANFKDTVNIARGDSIRVTYSKANGNQLYVAFVVPPDIPRKAEILLSQALDRDGYAVARASIAAIIDTATGAVVSIPSGLTTYEAYVNYGSKGVTVLNVAGIRPFDGIITSLNIEEGTRTKVIGYQSSVPDLGPPLELADLRVRLMGSKDSSFKATLNFLSITPNVGGNIPQTNPYCLSLRRGDADNNGVVDMADAMEIAQYLADSVPGSATVSEYPINAASVRHDGANGDKISIQDAMYIAQSVVGLRDHLFNPMN